MNKIVAITLLSLNCLSNTFIKYPIQDNNIIISNNDNKRKEIKIGYINTDKVNIKKDPKIFSSTLRTIDFNEKIEYIEENNEWVRLINSEYVYAYINKKYISNTKFNSNKYKIPINNSFKSYMSYSMITDKKSLQYKIQKNYAYTGKYGIRQVGERYCIALGTHFKASVGQYIDLKLKNGEVIKCILSEIKDNRHTDENNIFTVKNGCCTEFIIDPRKLNKKAKRDGTISSCKEEWNSMVSEIIIYEKNILGE